VGEIYGSNVGKHEGYCPVSRDAVYFGRHSPIPTYSRTSLIRINWGAELSGYENNLDNMIYFF
jgi:hypothetical protein